MTTTTTQTAMNQNSTPSAVLSESNSSNAGNRYHDYSSMTESEYYEHFNSSNTEKSEIPSSVFSSTSQSRCTTFPEKAHYMLQELEKDGNTDIVAWQPHGRCFVVRDRTKLESLLPLWFQQTRYASFQRQLNLYGFRRISKGVDKGAYYHELFLRGKQFLCKQIKTTRIRKDGYLIDDRRSKTTSKQASDGIENDDGEDPNFYAMPCMPSYSATSNTSTAEEVTSSMHVVARAESVPSAAVMPQQVKRETVQEQGGYKPNDVMSRTSLLERNPNDLTRSLLFNMPAAAVASSSSLLPVVPVPSQPAVAAAYLEQEYYAATVANLLQNHHRNATATTTNMPLGLHRPLQLTPERMLLQADYNLRMAKLNSILRNLNY